MTLLATAKRQAGGAWQSLGFALAYPWFKFIEWQTNYKYRGDGEFIDIEMHRHTDYENGEIAGLLSAIPSMSYLALLVSVTGLSAEPWTVLAVTLCILASVEVMGEVSVRALGGDGR